uniref:DNA-directed RNA polymerase M/15kDa subunit domain-containing protein n=1 Tax=viral metagenome TaxID=1070528 RepID=A0A6C0CP43_9ZZZZ
MSNLDTIRFCNICDNKLYHQVEEDSLIYFCRVCGNKNSDINEDSVCVLNVQIGTETNKSKPMEHVVNKYTKYDPTLPHIVLPCPNETCTTNKISEKTGELTDNKADIIYMRYNNKQMKHLYMCSSCDFTWTSN